MTTESTTRINRRVITRKGQPFEDWWHPIELYLTNRSPVFRSFKIVGAAAVLGNDLFVSHDTAFMTVVRHGADSLLISGFIVDSRNKTGSDPSGFHFFEAELDIKDSKIAWRIAALLDNVFNCSPLDPDHQDELERLLFST